MRKHHVGQGRGGDYHGDYHGLKAVEGSPPPRHTTDPLRYGMGCDSYGKEAN